MGNVKFYPQCKKRGDFSVYIEKKTHYEMD